MTDPDRRCERLTTAGWPCRRLLQWYEVACLHHATKREQDAALERLRAARKVQDP